MHEVELRGRKILVIHDKGNFSAVNGICPHYNWPLINGVYSNGKIRCALHGACFSTATGDIEDYPSFDGLHPFKIEKKGDNLVISTTEKRLISDRHTKPNWIRRITTEQPIIVVGGDRKSCGKQINQIMSGPAAQSVVENLRMEGCRTPIVMMTKEAVAPYDRVLLSKNMAIPAVQMRPAEFYTENKIEIRNSTEVTSIDTVYHSVTLSDGSAYEYSKLVIAVGSAVRKLRNDGSDLEGVHTVRNHADPAAVMADATGEDVVCIGASFIGMEAACAVVGVAKSVTVICTTAEPVPAFGEQIGRSVRLFFEGKGVRVITKARVSKLSGEDGRVKEVHLVDGTVVPSRCVVAGIGVDPDTAWLGKCGIELDSKGFVKTAQKHGQLAARSMLNKSRLCDNVPFFWAMFFWQISIRFTGISEGHDSVILRGDTDSFTFVQYYLKDNRVIAVCSAGPSLASIQFESICARKLHLTREQVENASDNDLSVFLK
ncbi:hypothetical protein PENTCL1PPCAC_28612 [Pristionchus entomophagus]|uniref:Rieske domain-containing protein n=1 Tax=Pristionchus entomophagus TaxID=358040 RepID=A0AAV5UIB4_9BILA|nr:hypothetical protein PENTCL1PPCAC_28612 [Pristionchus entomophagus]